MVLSSRVFVFFTLLGSRVWRISTTVFCGGGPKSLLEFVYLQEAFDIIIIGSGDFDKIYGWEEA